MQNRLVITGIPSSVPHLPNATDTLRDLVEEHGCWVDRFTFLHRHLDEDGEGGSTTDNSYEYATFTSTNARTNVDVNVGDDDDDNDDGAVAAAELHIENVRDRAVKSLDRLYVVLNQLGDIHWSGHSNDEGSNIIDHQSTTGSTNSSSTAGTNTKQTLITFQIRAFPANAAQSRQLVELYHSLDSELEDKDAEKKMEKQILKLPFPCNDIELVVRRSDESGGTGSNPWRGGVILAMQICLWFGGGDEDNIQFEQEKAGTGSGAGAGKCVIDFKSLFEKKLVLELGAGSASLPSMTIASICKQNKLDIDLITSDGVDETVTALKRNISNNKLNEYIRVKHIDWNDESTFCDDKSSKGSEGKGDEKGDENIKADTIIFSDCVYNEEGATALCNAICKMLKKGGQIIGVLPDFRVGLDLFEKMMVESHFVPIIIPMMMERKGKKETPKNEFTCSGGGGKHYRLLFWRDCRFIK